MESSNYGNKLKRAKLPISGVWLFFFSTTARLTNCSAADAEKPAQTPNLKKCTGFKAADYSGIRP
jgi:hypothetical protein